MAADPPTPSRPPTPLPFLPYPSVEDLPGAALAAEGAEARVPPQWPETPMGAWRIPGPRTLERARVPLTLVSLCRRSVYVCTSVRFVYVYPTGQVRNRGDRGLNHRPSLSLVSEGRILTCLTCVYINIYIYTCKHTVWIG